DDLSGADKLRVIWSNQFAWTPEGIPIVTVGLLDGREEVTVVGQPGVRVLPDGEGGAEGGGGSTWKVRLSGGGRAETRWYVVVASGRASDNERAQLLEQAATWRQRGFAPRTFELGTVFGLRGEVIDMRRLLVAVAPQDSLAAAQKEAKAIGAKY